MTEIDTPECVAPRPTTPVGAVVYFHTMRIKVLFTWLAIVTVAAMAHAATTANVALPPQSPTYSETEINLSTQKLPPYYLGNDPKRLYGPVVKLLGNKGKFETTEQFKQRLIENQTKPLFGTLTPRSIFASKIQLADTTYDADKGQLHFSDELGTHNISFNPDAKPCDWRQSIAGANDNLDINLPIFSNGIKYIMKSGSYTGQNSYGATAVIKTQTIHTYGLIVNNFCSVGVTYKDPDYKSEGFSFSFNVPMKPSVAKASKDYWSTLVIYTLAPPFTYNKVPGGGSIPTLANPYDTTINKYYLSVIVKEIWFYNSKTGEIYYKFKPQT